MKKMRSNDFYKNIVEKSSIGYAYHEVIYNDEGLPTDYRFLEVNPAFEEFTGLSGEKIIGNTVLEVMPEIEKDPFDWISVYGNVALRDENIKFISFSEPLQRWYKVEAFSPAKDHFITAFTDISELKQKEKELIRSQLLLKASLDSPKGIIVLSLDRQYNYLYYNETHKQTMKQAYNADIEVGKCIFDYISNTEDIKKSKNNYDKALNGISHMTRELYGDLEIKTYETFYNPIKDDNDNIIGASAYSRDITDRLMAEENLERERKIFETLFDSSPDFIYIKDLELKHIMANKALCEFFGVSKKDIIGKTDFDFLPKEDAEQCRSSDLAALNNKEPKINLEMVGDRVFETYKYPIYVENDLLGVASHIKDISIEYRQREKLSKISETYRVISECINRPFINEQEHLDYALSQALLITKSAYGYIYLYDETKKEFTLNTWSNGVLDDCEVMDKQTKYFLEKTGIWGEVVRKKEPLMINDFQKPNPLKKGYPNGHVELDRFLSLPIIINNKIVATIGLANKNDDYTEDDISVISILMSGIWNILEKSQKEKETKELLERTQSMFNNHKAIMLIINPDTGKIIDANPAAIDFYGYTKDELISKSVWDLNTLRKNEVQELMHKVINSEQNYFTFSHKLKDGQVRQVDVYSSSIAYNKNKALFSILFDVTKREEAIKQNIQTKNQLSLILASVEEAIYGVDNFGNCTFVNNSFQNLLGYDEDDVIGKNIHSIIHHSYPDGTKYEENDCPMSKAFREGKNVFIPEDYLWTKNGKTVPVEYYSNPIFNGNDLLGSVVAFKDITEKLKAINELKYVGYHDFLTNLFNRRYFVEKLNEFEREKKYPFGILNLDVNGLKTFNDVYGHGIGDEVLKKISQVFVSACNTSTIIARMGGDEFSAIIPNADEQKTVQIRDKILREISAITIKNIHLSVSIGYFIKVDDNVTLEEALKFAENDMYKHKVLERRSNKNRAIQAILKTLTDKFKEEKIHSTRVANISMKIGKKLGMLEHDLKALKNAAIFHDIGKISIPDEILRKPGKLTKEEFDVIKNHTEIGYQILRAADEYSDLAIHALHHHERWDGKGYPKKIKGNKIPLMSRIIGLADAYEAMTSKRVYKEEMSEDEAIEEIIRCSGTQFDPTIARIFVEKVMNRSWIQE